MELIGIGLLCLLLSVLSVLIVWSHVRCERLEKRVRSLEEFSEGFE